MSARRIFLGVALGAAIVVPTTTTIAFALLDDDPVRIVIIDGGRVPEPAAPRPSLEA